MLVLCKIDTGFFLLSYFADGEFIVSVSNSKYKPYLSVSMNKELLMEKSPKDLEKIGRKHGLELDRRKKKETLVDELYVVL